MSEPLDDWDTMLPQGSELGALHITQVHAFYDRPVLFVCVSDTGQRYLVVLIDEEPGSDIWLYLPLSESRLADLIAARVDLHTAFSQPEGLLYEVCDDDPVQQRDPATLTPTDLPKPGAFLCH